MDDTRSSSGPAFPASNRKRLFPTVDASKAERGSSNSNTSRYPLVSTTKVQKTSTQPEPGPSQASATSTSDQCNIIAKPHQNTYRTLSPSKFLPMLFDDEEESSELDDDDDDDWPGDSASGGVGSPDGSEDEMETTATHNNTETNESVQEGGDASQQGIHSFMWSDGSDFVPHLHPFNNTYSGVTDEWPCDANARESDYFRAFFNDATIDLIISETNKYYQYLTNKFTFPDHSRVHKWIDTAPQEFYVFLALMLLMPLINKHNIADYWKIDPLIPTPIFLKFMSRDRFLLLTKFMHFADNNHPDKKDAIWKIRSFFKMILEPFSKFFYPFQKVVIDESLILFKGRLVFKQYIPSKRHRFGLKIFVLCDCETGIVLDMIMYTGTDVDIPNVGRTDPLGKSGAIVKKMMSPYLGKGHILYTDNWYTSPALLQFLHDNATGACGTAKLNRKFMPKFDGPVSHYDNPSDGDDEEDANKDGNQRKKTKSRPKCYQKETSGKILAMKWTDKKPVHLLSTVHKGEVVATTKVHYKTKKTIFKPDIVVDYTENMRLIDKCDSQLSGVECLRKKFKWYHKFFLHMVDVTMLNTYNIWLVKNTDPTARKLKFREFVYNVAYQLLEEFGTVTNSRHSHRGHRASERPDRLLASEYITRHHLRYTDQNERTNKKKQLNCHVCANTSRGARKRTRVTTLCRECDVPLCPTECFAVYHTMKNY